jgi:hypothetical protein
MSERSERRLSEMADEAEHALRRYELYKAKVYGPKATSPGRLRDLKRDADRAKLALHRKSTEETDA